MGNQLFREITDLTGLPEDLIGEELKQLLELKGVAPEQMTMDSLREALSNYLKEVSVQMEDEDRIAETSSASALLPLELSPDFATGASSFSKKAPTQ